MNFLEKMKTWQDLINLRLDQALHSADLQPARLHTAMRHSMNAGGKRLRPILALAAHELFPGKHDPVPAGLALECIHTYSLIHDDLPAMDNSDLRRGRPSCHKAFDEATAILAGDAFQPLAFEILANAYIAEPELAIDLIQILAKTAGSLRLVGGQMQDLVSEGTVPDEDKLSYIHSNKTAAMIQAAIQMGFRLGSKGKVDRKMKQIGKVGHSLGLAFQAVDDLLDVSSTTTELGKDALHDIESGKITWVTLKGEDEARRLAAGHTNDARQFLKPVGGDSSFLNELMNFMLERNH
ncbi:MAG: polyprenyl synthetase family protein [Opitutae bacterium]|jgi:geranylgeranyl diphosphate synthase, type II|nr:polyprenyl synthetase family protein [Opitutae bacterium]MDA8823594.1 polyprenyl synthetase family protein [Opitutales bacterium]